MALVMLVKRTMVENSRPIVTLLLAGGIALIVGIFAANAHRRSAEMAQLVRAVHRIQIPISGYAMETTGLSSTPEDSAWRGYCELERVTLIEEARAAAAQ